MIAISFILAFLLCFQGCNTCLFGLKYMRNKEFTQCKVNVITEYLNKIMTLSEAFDQSFIRNGICSATITPEFTNDVAPFQFQPCYTKDDDFNKIFCLSKKINCPVRSYCNMFGSADVASYKALMLPSECIEPVHLESIKYLVKDYLQGLTNATLRLYAFASDQDTSPGYFMARLARESAMKQIQEC